MATCTGIELTSSPLLLNHHNAFPLLLKEYTQDAGAPLPAQDPEIQIERLALWDDESDKLVQQNHPNIEAIFFDRDRDGTRDQGYSRMFDFIDVIEIHPLGAIMWKPFTEQVPEGFDPTIKVLNRIHSWMRILNSGHRIPGVVNTDAHDNFHGSGWLRNFVKSPTDDPSEIRTLDIVHAAERGNVIMTNGPFLDVWIRSKKMSSRPEGTAGDDVIAPDGSAALNIRVQCPNWFDVDRVQVVLNGRSDPVFNFTRDTHSGLFSDEVVRFAAEVELNLVEDTHVIVVAAGERSRLRPVMGPTHQDRKPVAISNPIFVDIDGSGFRPNGDRLHQEN
jgi:hypothetical protein